MANEVMDSGGRALFRWSVGLLVLATTGTSLPAQRDPDPMHAVSTMTRASEDERPSAVEVESWPRAAVEPIVPIHTAEPDLGVAYGVWGAGPGYKASFHDGATFVPMLGRDYPDNQPWRWHTTSVVVGETELVTQEPRLSYEGIEARYELGGVVEVYELRRDGLEQTFVLPRRVSSGDLVVRGAVVSSLTAQATGPQHQELRFVDADGRHLVTYGAAVAVDADGRRMPMTTSYEGCVVTLRLDGAWLADAAFPVVVDPLLGAGTMSYGPDRAGMDIVRDRSGTAHPVWVCYSQWASASDQDVYLWRYDEDGYIGTQAFVDISANWSSQGARSTYDNGEYKIVTVFERWFAATGFRRLRFHLHDMWDQSASNTYGSIATTDNAWRPDVGGAFQGATGDVVLVVWQQEANGGAFQETAGSDIYGCYVDTAAETAGAPFPIADGPLTDNERPSVNRMTYGFYTSTWRVAWQTRTTFVIGGTDDWDIGVVEVDRASNVSAPLFIDSGSSDHKMAPQIEGWEGRYLVAFTASPNTGSAPNGVNGHELRTVRVDWPGGAGAGTEPWGTETLVSYNDARVELGGCAFERSSQSHWLMTWRSNVTEAIYVRTVGFRGQTLQGALVLAPASGTSVLGGACLEGSGGDPRKFMFVYGVNQGNASSLLTVNRFALPTAPPPQSVGVGCGPAAIHWSGTRWIGGELNSVHVDLAAVDSIHLCVLALAPASLQLFGVAPIQDGCWLLVPSAGPDFVGLFPPQIGSSVSWPLALPEQLDSMTLYLQGFYTLGGGVFEFASTPRLEVSIVK